MKTVLITGAAGGVGKVMARYFLQKDWHVIGCDIDCIALDEFHEDSKFRSIQVDVTSDQSIARALIEINSAISSLDGLANSAGIFDHFPLAEGSPDQFEKVFSVNVLGAIRMTRALFPLLRAGKGRIVNISSETALASLPMQVYGVSKRMLEVYTDALRLELGLIGMKVITIRPGAHSTKLLSHSRKCLGQIEENSAFKEILYTVKDKGQMIIDQGASDPKDIAKIVYLSVTVPSPRRVYHVNVSHRFKILAWLPRVLKEYIVHRILTTKG